MLQFDEQNARRVEATYMTPDMVEQRRATRALLSVQQGERVLDIGSDSLVWRSSDDGRMARVLAAWNEHLADPYLPRRLPELLDKAGFELRECSVIAVLNRSHGADSFSGGVLENIPGVVPRRPGLTPAE